MAAQTFNDAEFSTEDITLDGEVEVKEKPVSEMTQKEARVALIAAVNQIRSDKNVKRLAEYREKYNAYHERGNYRIPAPKRPIFVTIFNARQIDQAVFMARQRGGFEDLLKKAGFRASK